MNKSEAGRLGAEAVKEKLARAKKQRVEKYNNNPKKCPYCLSALSYENRRNTFCNHSCAQSFNNAGVARNIISHKFVKKPCAVCGKETNNPRYCSSKCFQESRWQETVNEIEKNNCLLYSGNGVYDYNPIVAKRYLAEKRGRKCEICNCDTWCDKPMPLILDHINGDPTNHTLENIRLVCGNCNMQLPTFAGRNRGNGRESRGIKRNH